MRTLALARCALTISAAASAAATLLTGCGGSQPPIGAPGAMSNGSYPAPHNKHSQTFSFTGDKQQFQVPAGVTQVTVVADGASGPYGAVGSNCTVIGGLGGLVQATISVTPGETLAVFVGGEGTIGAACYSEYGNGIGGFNGGGDGGSAGYGDIGDGAGGASDVREGSSALSDRILVAGGGGYYGGGGGGGGAGGEDGCPGGGAGGGSSYVESGARSVKNQKGAAPPGNGQIVISW
jgi:hypothetical protein